MEGGGGGIALRWCLKAVEVKGWGLLGDILVELGHYEDDERKRGGGREHTRTGAGEQTPVRAFLGAGL